MATRTSFQSLSEAQIAALPKTTRWRGQQRGWVVLNYRAERAHMLANPAPSFDFASAYDLAKRLVSAKLGTMAFPSFLDPADLIQECVFEVWRVSAKPGAESRKWQCEVMMRRLLRLQSRCRGDRDKFNCEGTYGETKKIRN